MAASWQFDLNSDFFSSFDSYAHQYLTPDAETILTGSPIAKETALSLAKALVAVNSFRKLCEEKTASPISALYPSRLNGRLYYLKVDGQPNESGPWRLPVLVQEDSDPKRAWVFAIFHKDDMSAEKVEDLLRTIEEKHRQWQVER